MRQQDHGRQDAEATRGRLAARPGAVAGKGAPGLHRLSGTGRREALLHVPSAYQGLPLPLAVMLHGAGGDAERTLGSMRSLSDATPFLLLVPASRGQTWDVLEGGYGPDVETIDAALAQVFAGYAVDPARLALGGFSDGASYALSLGLINGDLFTHLLAFAPGFMAPAAQRGQPRIFISHGTRDAVLPIDRCSRRIVPQLRRAGYDVRYDEFDGPHTVPPAIAAEAIAWFTVPA
jgi:phospholipase/carboxylesterase